MILAAGFGKRVRPLTLNCPKPLLKIGKETLLSNTIEFLKKFGIKEITINTHYLSEQIINYINEKKFSVKINLAIEKNHILDTGGGVLNVIKNFSKEPFIIINPDTIWNSFYLEELKLMEKKFIENSQNKSFLLVVDRKKSFDKSLRGDFSLKKDLINRKQSEDLNYIYTGLQIMKTENFLDLNEKVFSINKIWDKLIAKDNLFGLESKNDFLHVSSLEIYKKLLNKFKH